MQFLHQKISSARKALGMTQEQLAQAMNVSRQTVSHWENGRVVPDEATAQRLAEILHIDWAEEASAPAAKPANRTFGLLHAFLFGAALALLAVFAVWQFMGNDEPSASAQTNASGAQPYSYEWFMEPDDSVPTHALVRISPSASPALLMYSPSEESEYLWKLQIMIEETTGIPFTIEKLTEVTFGADNVVLNTQEVIGEEVMMILPSAKVEMGNMLGFHIGIVPGGGETAFGVAIEGTDATGSALRFTCLVPLSYEVSPVLTRAHFENGAAQVEGKPYIVISAAEEPIPQIYNPVFEGDYGWEYMYTIENVTDEPFTVTRIVEAYIIGDEVVFSSAYDQESFAQWGYASEMTKENPFTGGSGANAQQGFESLGLRVEGVDKDGNELVFARTIPFSQERPQP